MGMTVAALVGDAVWLSGLVACAAYQARRAPTTWRLHGCATMVFVTGIALAACAGFLYQTIEAP